MEKFAFFAFKGDPLCFVHVMLNVLDMADKGWDARIIMEGESVVLVKQLIETSNPTFLKIRERGLIDCICKACSKKFEVLEYNENTGIPIKGEMSGHPAMSWYTERGYQIITM